jgi:hypothetical protein
MQEMIYQTRDDLYPRFGLALPERQQVYVRDDLPERVERLRNRDLGKSHNPLIFLVKNSFLGYTLPLTTVGP